MIPVTVSLAVRIVLVQHELVSPSEPRHVVEALAENPLADALVCHDFTRVCAFGRGILRMSAIDIEPAAVGEDLVQLAVVIWVRPFPLALHFKPSSIEQRILVLIVPHRMRNRNAGIMA